MTEFAGSQYVIEVVYLIASALFILSLKWMSSPATARHGILAGEIGMVLAIGGTLLRHGIVDYKWIIIALVLDDLLLDDAVRFRNQCRRVVKGCIAKRISYGS